MFLGKHRFALWQLKLLVHNKVRAKGHLSGFQVPTMSDLLCFLLVFNLKV